jgi:hypothetical protein
MPETRVKFRHGQAIETPKTEDHGADEHSRQSAAGRTLEDEGDEGRRTVKEWHVKKDLLDFVELIRSIQRTEGNPDCFRKKCSCEEMDCAWRSYCLTEHR